MTYMKSKTLQILSFVTFLVAAFSADAKPLKAILITGGCCHDYPKQKNIISEGISERVPTKWDIFFEMDENDLKEMHAEFLIMVQYFDETFDQEVYQIHSYLSSDLQYGVKFIKAYYNDSSGSTVLDHNLLSAVEPV